METFIQYIIQKKIPCYFISPHLGDAADVHNLLRYLASYTKVVVVSVFTASDKPPYSLAAKQFLRISGETNFNELLCVQKQKDISVCKLSGIDFVHLDFTPGLLRKRKRTGWIQKKMARFIPELIHLYPFGRMTGSVLAKEDKQTVIALQEKLLSLLPKKSFVVFCPLGVVNNMDHILLRDTCLISFPQLVFWHDSAHSLHEKKDLSFVTMNHLKKFSWNSMHTKKTVLKVKDSTFKNMEKNFGAKEVYYVTSHTITE